VVAEIVLSTLVVWRSSLVLRVDVPRTTIGVVCKLWLLQLLPDLALLDHQSLRTAGSSAAGNTPAMAETCSNPGIPWQR